jgi:hypothetical protein
MHLRKNIATERAQKLVGAGLDTAVKLLGMPNSDLKELDVFSVIELKPISKYKDQQRMSTDTAAPQSWDVGDFHKLTSEPEYNYLIPAHMVVAAEPALEVQIADVADPSSMEGFASIAQTLCHCGSVFYDDAEPEPKARMTDEGNDVMNTSHLSWRQNISNSEMELVKRKREGTIRRGWCCHFSSSHFFHIDF